MLNEDKDVQYVARCTLAGKERFQSPFDWFRLDFLHYSQSILSWYHALVQ